MQLIYFFFSRTIARSFSLTNHLSMWQTILFRSEINAQRSAGWNAINQLCVCVAGSPVKRGSSTNPIFSLLCPWLFLMMNNWYFDNTAAANVFALILQHKSIHLPEEHGAMWVMWYIMCKIINTWMHHPECRAPVWQLYYAYVIFRSRTN